jgi:hypothetical protein
MPLPSPSSQVAAARPKLSPLECATVAAATRWGPPRVLRLGDLTPDQRRLILALVEAKRGVPDQTSPESQRLPGGDWASVVRWPHELGPAVVEAAKAELDRLGCSK